MGEKCFEDEEIFPDGFAESGAFSYAEEELLTYWGETMYALEVGHLIPENSEEEHFVQVIEGSKLARSCLEKVWLKYKALSGFDIHS
ncbi:DUF413 domain-containing protein [Vibrio sp. DW001]|uniref:DUF413 domain-containing protein n=1 Tax=Vibrio sp. DW001 TaxID=2912315 RepID=UPI0023AE7422|nr:DUF413 domain-containing protein [Vibrio sp. DW001]WED28831.1 DUF413 domain-containing protein [Vibrio sp. DW001]